MDPISAPPPNLSAVLQALLVRQGLQPADVDALRLAVGQELSLLFLGQSAEGAMLELPNGRVVTAQGQLPFPEGTQVRVRVESEAGALKFQTLEATPPGTPALLAPLLQGEAASLAARLQQSSPNPDLAPLVNLLRLLGGSIEPGPKLGIPTLDVLAQAITALPKEQASSLTRALGTPPAAEPLELAQRLSNLLGEEAGLAERSSAGAGSGDPKQVLATAEWAMRVQGMLQRVDMPAEHRTTLDSWIRSLLTRSSGPMESSPKLGLPAPEVLAKAIAALPKEQTASLARALGAPSEVGPMELARYLSDVLEENPGLAERSPIPAGPGDHRQNASADVLARFQWLLRRVNVPAEHRTVLDGWIRNLLARSGGSIEALPKLGLPALDVLAKAIAGLPKEQAASLGRALGASPAAEPLELARRLSSGLEENAARPERSPALARSGDPKQPPSLAAEWLARFQGLLQRSDMPAEHRTALDGWLRSLLARRSPEVMPVGSSFPEATKAALPQSVHESRILAPAEAARMEVVLATHAGAPAQVPEVWENWIKGSMRALSDAVISPREAPFHALQAKEGTAFFEIPLPWAGGKPLQLWVEEDASEHSAKDFTETKRVLLGLHLSRLGETRVALQSCGGALSVRIWSEHPEFVEGQRDAVERELRESGKKVDLRILPLDPGPDGNIPDLRSLVAGSSLHAMG
jgi:hypothetical protein